MSKIVKPLNLAQLDKRLLWEQIHTQTRDNLYLRFWLKYYSPVDEHINRHLHLHYQVYLRSLTQTQVSVNLVNTIMAISLALSQLEKPQPT